jgi:hypothetical protein
VRARAEAAVVELLGLERMEKLWTTALLKQFLGWLMLRPCPCDRGSPDTRHWVLASAIGVKKQFGAGG